MTDKKSKVPKAPNADEISEAAGKVADAFKDALVKPDGGMTTGAKVGAAIGSAAVAAALIYAGRHQVKKHDDFSAAKPGPLPKYENEPDYDDYEDDDDMTSDYYGGYDEEEE